MKIPKLLQAALYILIGYAVTKYGIPLIGRYVHYVPGTEAIIPTSLMKIYTFFIVSGVILYMTYDDESAKEMAAPILKAYGGESMGLRVGAMAVVCLLGGYVTYQYVKPSYEAPVELRSIHPAPPSSISFKGKSYNMLTLVNPLREDKENFAENVKKGGIVYYENCFYCHGDKLAGKGHYAQGFNPRPANFQDVGTIAQLQESFLFWRISTGGPGLPKEGTPWISAMPLWHDFLSEEEIWQVILFLYDYTGHSPRTF